MAWSGLVLVTGPQHVRDEDVAGLLAAEDPLHQGARQLQSLLDDIGSLGRGLALPVDARV
jgi:hypothetical protein